MKTLIANHTKSPAACSQAFVIHYRLSGIALLTASNKFRTPQFVQSLKLLKSCHITLTRQQNPVNNATSISAQSHFCSTSSQHPQSSLLWDNLSLSLTPSYAKTISPITFLCWFITAGHRITPSLFQSRLKTHLFHKSFPPQTPHFCHTTDSTDFWPYQFY